MDIATIARLNAPTILHSTVLAIDPASGGTSDPGFAFFRASQLVANGTLPLRTMGSVQHRLRFLYSALRQYQADVLVIEQIRGVRTHEYLHWSVGVSVAAVAPAVLIEMPVATWKKLAGDHHQKSDKADALAIGQALIHLASQS
jgi:Holliday junction resolvasome RuvABC endonuclease subunit